MSLSNIKTLQEFLDTTSLNDPRNSVYTFLKSIESKNITIEEWNTVILQISDLINKNKETFIGFEKTLEAILQYALTFQIGTVTTTAPGSQAVVENVGTQYAPILNFELPRGIPGTPGAPGKDGDDGATPEFSIGSVTTLPVESSAEVTLSGTFLNPVLNFKLPRGLTGPKGDGFSIYKTYPSLAEMNADTDTVPEGKYVIISTDQNDEDNAKVYVKRGDGTFGFLTDMSGAQGIQGPAGESGPAGQPGPAGTIEIGTVTQVDEDAPLKVTNTGTGSEAVLNFEIPRGKTGYLGSIKTVDGDELFFFVGTEAEYEALDDSVKMKNLFAVITDDDSETRLLNIEKFINNVKSGSQIVGSASRADVAKEAEKMKKSWTPLASGNLSKGSYTVSLPVYFEEDTVYMFRVKATITGHTYIHTFFSSIPPIGHSGLPVFVSEIHKYPTGSGSDDINCWLSFSGGYQAVTATFKTTDTSRTDAIVIEYREFC